MHAIDGLSGDPSDPATTLLAAVTSGLSLAREPRLVRARFEEELRSLVHARSVAVRECAVGRVGPPAVVSIDVPAGAVGDAGLARSGVRVRRSGRRVAAPHVVGRRACRLAARADRARAGDGAVRDGTTARRR